MQQCKRLHRVAPSHKIKIFILKRPIHNHFKKLRDTKYQNNSTYIYSASTMIVYSSFSQHTLVYKFTNQHIQ